jgi:DNA-binding HxlR family transcriptional regulator
MSRAMNLIGDTWTLVIVYNLMGGPRRFGELLEAMGSVSPKTVSQRLKMLEQKGFVERHAFAEIPPRVEYHLLEKGRALMDVIEAIRQFGERYLADDDEAF